MKRKKPQGSSKRVPRAAKPVQSNKVATTRKSGTVPQNTQEPKGVSFRGKFVKKKIKDYEAQKDRASTELVRGARLALAEAVLREMQVKKMTPLANKLPKNKGGRGYAQLDTIDQMAARHKKAIGNTRRNNQRLSDKAWAKLVGPLGQHPKDRKP